MGYVDLTEYTNPSSSPLKIWSKTAFVCSQELQHSAYTWKQAVQKNVHNQLLAIPKGAQYIHALREVYRVAKIVRTSAKFHKPWMLSGHIDCASLFARLNKCNSLWLASRLQENHWTPTLKQNAHLSIIIQ